MKTFTALAIGLGSSLLIGCNTEYKGRMQIPAPLVAQGQKNLFTIPAGDHSLRVLFKSKKEVHLLVKVSKKQEERIRLKSKSDLPFPSQGGELFLTGAQINQPFNISAHVDYRRSETPERYRIDSCSVSTEVRVCHLQPDNSQTCTLETKSLSGRQEVRYYTVSESRVLTGELQALSDGRALAALSSTNQEAWEVVTGRSPCVLDRHHLGIDPILGGSIVLGH